MRKNIRLHWIIPLVFVAVLLLFYGLFQTDNKYTAALPGGAGYNVLQRTSEEVSFLVDGWEYYPGQLLAPADFQADPPALEESVVPIEQLFPPAHQWPVAPVTRPLHSK